MNTSDHSLTGLEEKTPDSTTVQRKHLTVSPSDDVSCCIETVTGNLVNPTNPLVSAIDIHDIAWALSRMPRFAGHSITEIPYNVAQHSIYVSELVEHFLEAGSLTGDEDQEVWDAIAHLRCTPDFSHLFIKALLHDAHEAYTGDVPSPVKRIPELRETLKLIEMKLDHAILSKFKLQEVTQDEKVLIKYCDKLAQAIEGYQYMPSRGLNWNLPKPSLTMLQKFSTPLSPLESYQAFLDRFDLLSNPQ